MVVCCTVLHCIALCCTVLHCRISILMLIWVNRAKVHTVDLASVINDWFVVRLTFAPNRALDAFGTCVFVSVRGGSGRRRVGLLLWLLRIRKRPPPLLPIPPPPLTCPLLLTFSYFQNTAAHCNILHTATHFSTRSRVSNTLQHTATHCNTPQHTLSCFVRLVSVCLSCSPPPLMSTCGPQAIQNRKHTGFCYGGSRSFGREFYFLFPSARAGTYMYVNIIQNVYT